MRDAVKRDDIPAARRILAKGGDVHAKDNVTRTPLHYARSSGMCDLLVGAGAEIDAFDFQHKTPLHYAVTSGNIPVVEYLLKRDANVNTQEMGGLSPLHDAVLLATPQIALLLISHKADVNALTNSHQTPLHYAVEFGRGHASIEIVKLLLAHGANVSLRDKAGFSAMDLAVKTGDGKMVAFLRQAEGTILSPSDPPRTNP